MSESLDSGHWLTCTWPWLSREFAKAALPSAKSNWQAQQSKIVRFESGPRINFHRRPSPKSKIGCFKRQGFPCNGRTEERSADSCLTVLKTKVGIQDRQGKSSHCKQSGSLPRVFGHCLTFTWLWFSQEFAKAALPSAESNHALEPRFWTHP